MRLRGSFVVAGALALAAGCGSKGSGGLPASGTDLSCEAGQFILDDMCTEFPPFSDATVVLDPGDATSADDSSDGDDAATRITDSPTDSSDAASPTDSLDDASDAANASDSGSLDASSDAPADGSGGG